MGKMVYCIEDDDHIREMIGTALHSFQFEEKRFASAEEFFDEPEVPDLILLDIMLPGMDGIEALSKIRNSHKLSRVPVIMLTAKTTEMDKIAGLDGGADDYISKPFSILELNSRIHAVLRRYGDSQPTKLEYKDLVLDPQKHHVLQNGRQVELTLKEYELLKLLMTNQNKVIERDELLSFVWGYDFIGESRTLDMHIKTLRKKLGDDAEHPTYIKTVRGVGYTLT